MKIDFDWHWILGSCIALCAAIMANTGLNLQKLSHLENSYYDPFTRKRPRPENDKSSMMSRPRWWIGIVLIVMASICDFGIIPVDQKSLFTLGKPENKLLLLWKLGLPVLVSNTKAGKINSPA